MASNTNIIGIIAGGSKTIETYQNSTAPVNTTALLEAEAAANATAAALKGPAVNNIFGFANNPKTSTTPTSTSTKTSLT